MSYSQVCCAKHGTHHCYYYAEVRVGRLQHEWLAGQEQRPDQRVRRTADAVVQGAARCHVLQGTRGRSVYSFTCLLPTTSFDIQLSGSIAHLTSD